MRRFDVTDFPGKSNSLSQQAHFRLQALDTDWLKHLPEVQILIFEPFPLSSWRGIEIAPEKSRVEEARLCFGPKDKIWKSER
jgi:hypothetical protein